jgi:hypothetical protein
MLGLFAFEGTKPSKAIAMPVLIRSLKDPDESVQVVAAVQMKLDFPEEMETNNVYALFPALRPALTNQVPEPK